MTSNLGADLIKKSTEVGFGAQEGFFDYEHIKEKIEGAVKKHFKPEFLNRLNDIVIFHPLNREALASSHRTRNQKSPRTPQQARSLSDAGRKRQRLSWSTKGSSLKWAHDPCAAPSSNIWKIL